MNAFPNAVRQFGLAALEARAEPPPTPGPAPAPVPPPVAFTERAPRAARRVVVRLWVPTTAVFWILSPFPLLLAPLAWFAPPQFRPANPYAAVFAIGRLLTSLGGTVVDVDTPDALVRIRLF